MQYLVCRSDPLPFLLHLTDCTGQPYSLRVGYSGSRVLGSGRHRVGTIVDHGDQSLFVIRSENGTTNVLVEHQWCVNLLFWL